MFKKFNKIEKVVKLKWRLINIHKKQDKKELIFCR